MAEVCWQAISCITLSKVAGIVKILKSITWCCSSADCNIIIHCVQMKPKSSILITDPEPWSRIYGWYPQSLASLQTSPAESVSRCQMRQQRPWKTAHHKYLFKQSECPTVKRWPNTFYTMVSFITARPSQVSIHPKKTYATPHVTFSLDPEMRRWWLILWWCSRTHIRPESIEFGSTHSFGHECFGYIYTTRIDICLLHAFTAWLLIRKYRSKVCNCWICGWNSGTRVVILHPL